MQEKNICPGCGRHCDLERPHCGRGEEYRRAGNMPERQGKHRDQKMQTVDDPAADINDGLILSLRDLHHPDYPERVGSNHPEGSDGAFGNPAGFSQ